ncbi:MAG: thrombospondin type 3 repeat-containing protein [bacterium]
MPYKKDNIKLTREQKTGFVLLLVFAILALSLGVLQIRNTMYKPFALSNQIPPLSDSIINDINVLRYRDTDQDGLNDFEELYVYETSPYLEDSDSDGIDDKQEVSKGTNPLCAQGMDCAGSVAINQDGQASDSVSSSLPKWITPPNQEQPADLANLLKDTKQLREMLTTAGVDQKILDQVSDEQLQAIIDDALKTTSTLQNLQSLYQTNTSTY